MAQLSEPFFGDWYTEKQLGSGTDGKVYLIARKNENGDIQRSVLKIIRLSQNRSGSTGFNSIGEVQNNPDRNYYENIIKDITDNISIIKQADGGKRFVNYLQWETKESTDGKGWSILIRMERMRSLASLLEEFSFTLEETLKIGISICRSLIRCRDFNYIYPNLKPENILFDNNGVCKLADFGSFSCLEPSRTSIAFKRTQYYMAPEFINTGRINCTADTYALGLVLYTLVNRGRLPFVEEYPKDVTINGLDRSKMNRLNGVELPRPAFASDALYEIILKACQKNESDRYLTPKQMLADLKNALANKPFDKAQYDEIYSSSQPGDTAADKPEEKPDDSLAYDQNGAEQYSQSQQSAKQADTQPPEENKEKSEREKWESFLKSANIEKYLKERKEVSLKDEISIPNVTPIDYATGKRPPNKKRQTSSKMPAITKNKNKNKNKNTAALRDMKTLVILAAAIVIVIALLFVSFWLKNSNDEQVQTVTTALIGGFGRIIEVIKYGG